MGVATVPYCRTTRASIPKRLWRNIVLAQKSPGVRPDIGCRQSLVRSEFALDGYVPLHGEWKLQVRIDRDESTLVRCRSGCEWNGLENRARRIVRHRCWQCIECNPQVRIRAGGFAD